VLALIVLGSVVGQLITRLRGQTEEKSDGKTLIGDVEKQPARTERARPAVPAAKPMPPPPLTQGAPPQTGASSHPQFGRPSPAHRPPEFPRTEIPPVQPQQRPGEFRIPGSTPVPARPARPVRRQKARPTRARQVPPPAAKPPTEHPRDLEVVTVSPKPGEPIREDLTAIRHPTRESLRRAILLSEVLGPPISLRVPDDTPWH
jgi:hypothetical protein